MSLRNPLQLIAALQMAILFQAVLMAVHAFLVNAFAFAVAELAYVRPLDRPGRGWLWQFNLTQGF